MAETKYAGLRVVKEDEDFVFNTVHVDGLRPAKWALVPVAAAKSIKHDYPDDFEIIDQDWIDAAIAEDTVYPGRVYDWDESEDDAKECREEANDTQKSVDLTQRDPSSPDFNKFEPAKEEIKKDQEAKKQEDDKKDDEPKDDKPRRGRPPKK